MSIVLWHVSMSVDGFIAGPNDDMDWMFGHVGPNEQAAEVIRSTGAILSGRRSYDVSRRPGPNGQTQKPYGGTWSGPVFVLTHRPPDDADPDITFLSCAAKEAVGTAVDAAAGRDVVLLGADIARQCLDAGLVDELLVHVTPTLLGDGVRLFSRPGPAVELEMINQTRSGEIVDLRFRLPR